MAVLEHLINKHASKSVEDDLLAPLLQIQEAIDEVRRDVEQAIIELRFDAMTLTLAEAGRQHEQQQRDEKRAYEEGRAIYGTADDHIDVEIVDPDEK